MDDFVFHDQDHNLVRVPNLRRYSDASLRAIIKELRSEFIRRDYELKKLEMEISK